MKSNDKLEMKVHLKAKYHIHFNLHVVKWSDKDRPPYISHSVLQAFLVPLDKKEKFKALRDELLESSFAPRKELAVFRGKSTII